MLAVEGLSKRFGGFLAVNQVSFEAREGEILGLIGPNGSGKSTTFNLIAGNLRPTQGSIRFEGAEIAGLAAHTICRQGIARTFQIPRPFRKLSLRRERRARRLLRRGRRNLAGRSAASRGGGARPGRAPDRRDGDDRRTRRGRAEEARTRPRARHQAAAPARRRKPGRARLRPRWSTPPTCSKASAAAWASRSSGSSTSWAC